METAALFHDILTSFDQTPFSPTTEHDVYTQLQKQIPDGYGELSAEEKAELMAFRFIEPHRKETTDAYPYYQPFASFKSEDGKVTASPAPEMVTAEVLTYWTVRAECAKHPILVARYSGLVSDFSWRQQCNAPYTIKKNYIESLLDIVEQKLYKVSIYSIDKASRALEIAITLNDAALIEQSKNLILALEKQITISDKPGTWGFSYDLLIGGKRKHVSTAEEKAIIRDLEAQLSHSLLIDSWCTECAAERLLDYFQKRKEPAEIKRVLASLETCYNYFSNGQAAIQKRHYIETLYEYYKKFQLNDEAEEFLKKLRQISRETDQDMKSVSAKLDIPTEKINQYVEAILKGNDTEIIFYRVVEKCSPDLAEVKSELESLAKRNPLSYMLSRNIVDNKGRQVAKIDPINQDPEGHLFLQLSYAMRTGTILLHFIFEEGNKRGIFTKHEIMKFLSKSCIIEQERLPIIAKGLDAYFAGDYTVAMHLFIPQFEEAIRNLVEMNGGNVMIQKNDSYNLKTFDHLLNDDIIKNVFGEDKTAYFRVLFTDRRGWNVRNNVAHGMMEPENLLNKQNIDCVLHAVLCLGMVRLVGNQPTKD